MQIVSWAQFLLKYALSHPAATVAIPGMTKVRHVDDNFGAAQGPMPDAAIRKQMEAFFDSL
jgi:aryl-alcohol dehydrogenase-like predicted oxidoreductase